LGVRKTGDPEVGGGARSGAGEPGLIEEPEVNREVDTATNQQSLSARTII